MALVTLLCAGACSDDPGAAVAAPAGLDSAADAPAPGDAKNDADLAGACLADPDCPDDGNPCTVSRCSPGRSCAQEARVDGAQCSDGDKCTLGDVCEAGVCIAGASVCPCLSDQDCLSQDDGDLCNGTLRCDQPSHQCVVDAAAVVVCDASADTVCAIATCAPATGVCAPAFTPTGTPCEDGLPCTAASACAAGACVAVTGGDQCACTVDEDCEDDGDLCNGVSHCAKAIFPFTCQINPATVVTCPASAGPCQTDACDPATGTCAVQPLADGTACDDGDPATEGDVCEAGVCVSGTDTSLCTDHDDCIDDGNLCNGVPFCNKQTQTCALNPATVVQCPSGGDLGCIKNTCNPLTGTCAPTALKPGTACDDGDACTASDICVGGACKAGTNICPCADDAACLVKDDGDLCNGVPYCDKAADPPVCKPNPASVVVCPTVDDSDCRHNLCDPKTAACALSSAATGTLCDDGDECTKSETCDGAGGCVDGTVICTCKSDSDCLGEDDGDLCNGLPYCDKGADPPVCKPNPSSVVSCPTVDDTPCLKNTCVPKSGQCAPVPTPAGTKCDDGDVCTKGDLCQLGLCVSGTWTCECADDGDCFAKDDGDLCNGIWYCDHSGAKPVCAFNPASVVWCAKGEDTACVKNVCDPKTGGCGLGPLVDKTPCAHPAKCATTAACTAGACLPTASLDCEDGDPCTTDSCDAVLGCGHATAQCDDGNDCTLDICDPQTGKCSFDAAKQSGKGCNADDNGCTVNDVCLAGVCQAGVGVVCKLDTAACEKATCVPSGASTFQCLVLPLADGAACLDEDGCHVGSSCQGGACQAGEGEKLFVATPGAAGRHVRLGAGVAWQGGYLVAGTAVAGDGAGDGPDAAGA